MLSPSQIEELAFKAKHNKLNQQEKILLDLWYDSHDDTSFDYQQPQKKTKQKIWANIVKETRIKTIKKLWPAIIAAACITLVAGCALFFYLNNQNQVTFTGKAKDIAAGGNKAYLILENGEKLDLSQKNAETRASKMVPSILDLNGEELVYQSDAKKNHHTGNTYNTIATPAGGQYKMTLADGSKVWLNAASSLRFPVSFAGNMQRVVELTGEGYFEVAKNTAQPFIVRSKNQSIKVLGTHFNVNAYENESATRTTLLEGSVQINNQLSTLIISPGEQAVNTGKTIKREFTQSTKDISWKNGYFEFHNDELTTVMRQLERWYGIKVVYSGEMPAKRFTGKIYRNLPLSGALKVITYFEVSFEVTDHTIYIKQ